MELLPRHRLWHGGCLPPRRLHWRFSSALNLLHNEGEGSTPGRHFAAYSDPGQEVVAPRCPFLYHCSAMCLLAAGP